MDVLDDKKSRDIQYEQILHTYQDKRRNLANAKESEARKSLQFYAQDAAKHNYSLAQKRVSYLFSCLTDLLVSYVFRELGKKQGMRNFMYVCLHNICG